MLEGLEYVATQSQVQPAEAPLADVRLPIHADILLSYASCFRYHTVSIQVDLGALVSTLSPTF